MKGFAPLNPSDHVLLVMDREIRREGLPGAWCAFALELGGRPDEAALSGGLDAAAAAFPTLTARLRQRGRRFGWQGGGGAIPLVRHTCPPGLDATGFWRKQLEALMHDPGEAAADDASPLSFHLLYAEDGTLLLARWLHPLMDAGGVKRLFDFIMSPPEERGRYLEDAPSLVDRRLGSWSWGRRLTLLWRGKRHNDRIDRIESSHPATTVERGRRSLRVRQLILDPEQTARILSNLRRRVGLGGQSLYFIACLMRALERMEPASRGAGWCIPYAFDLRPGNAPVPVTGNQVGVLFAQAPHAVARDRDAVFQHLKTQHAEAIRQELDMAYLPLMWLGRWLSLSKYARILRRQKTGGERSSAWFSDIGEIRFSRPDFLGAPIVGVRHGCFVTSPPSLAVLFSRFGGRLSLSINHLLPDLPAEWIERFQTHLVSELLAD